MGRGPKVVDSEDLASRPVYKPILDHIYKEFLVAQRTFAGVRPRDLLASKGRRVPAKDRNALNQRLTTLCEAGLLVRLSKGRYGPPPNGLAIAEARRIAKNLSRAEGHWFFDPTLVGLPDSPDLKGAGCTFLVRWAGKKGTPPPQLVNLLEAAFVKAYLEVALGGRLEGKAAWPNGVELDVMWSFRPGSVPGGRAGRSRGPSRPSPP